MEEQMVATHELSTLIIQARDGDSDAFATVVRRFQDMAVGYGYSLLGDLGHAQDAAQEAFLEAYLCLSQLREPEAFPRWFRRIVFKQCDRMTRGKGLNVVPLQSAAEKVATEQNQVVEMETRELKDQVWEAIDSLPEHERTAVTLYYLSGYSQQEVGNFLDVPVTTVKKRLFSARRRLHKMLFDLVGEALRERRPSRDERFASTVLEMLTAARTGDVGRVRELFQQNPRLLTARDWLGNSALIMAVNAGHPNVAELLFNAGVLPDVHEAAAIGQTERVRALLDEDENRLDSFSAEGFTPLALAAHFGHQDIAEYLLRRGADPNIASRHPLQVTPLHAALFGRRTDTARLLIEHGADVNLKRGGKGWPRAGWTALHYAAGFGVIDLVERLVARGADLNAEDDAGMTPLAVAMEEKQEEVASFLRDKGTQS